jgi:hypothetical protein
MPKKSRVRHPSFNPYSFPVNSDPKARVSRRAHRFTMSTPNDQRDKNGPHSGTPRGSQVGSPRPSHHGSQLGDHRAANNNSNQVLNTSIGLPNPIQPRPTGPVNNVTGQQNLFGGPPPQHNFGPNGANYVHNWVPPPNQFVPQQELPYQNQYAPVWGYQNFLGNQNQDPEPQFPTFGAPQNPLPRAPVNAFGGEGREPNPNSLRSRFAPNLSGSGNCFELLPYKRNADYKISPSIIAILPKFRGLKGENPYSHLTAFKYACNSVNE